jgi:Holliday junction resolvase-like predicted endonuclease
MYWVQLQRERWLARTRNARGRRGEEQAVQLLTAAGYVIVARQQRAAYALRSGESAMQVKLSFDFVVEKDGKICVAEVKTGALGPQLKHADTRRQLLEYQLASGASEVLLVDPEREQISQVSFPIAPPQLATIAEAASSPDTASAGNVWSVLICVAFCCLCAYLWLR